VRGASPGASLLGGGVGAGDIKVDPSMTTPEKDSINDSEVSGSKLVALGPLNFSLAPYHVEIPVALLLQFAPQSKIFSNRRLKKSVWSHFFSASGHGCGLWLE